MLLPEQPNWGQVLSATLDAEGEALRRRAQDLRLTHGRLQGTEHQRELVAAMRAWLTGPDLRRQALALGFFQSVDDDEAYTQIVKLAEVSFESWGALSNPIPWRSPTMQALLASVLASLVRRGRPYGDVQGWMRAAALSPNSVLRVVSVLASHDRAWLGEHLQELLRIAPDATAFIEQTYRDGTPRR